jgi:hypothetical protein
MKGGALSKGEAIEESKEEIKDCKHVMIWIVTVGAEDDSVNNRLTSLILPYHGVS